MLLYYRGAGANATLALLLNGVLLIAILACFGAVLTLPGIAGVVLTRLPSRPTVRAAPPRN